MIKLQGSRFTDILPDNLARDLEVQALAYAVGRQIEKVCAYSDAARTYAAIATLPERILDILAVELRTPAYKETYQIDIKRALVQETITFHMKMGTPSAVEQVIKSIFGDGYIAEWFEYGGDPFHFKAFTTNQEVTGEAAVEFRRALGTVKRLSAWMDEIVIVRTWETIFGTRQDWNEVKETYTTWQEVYGSL